MSELRQGAGYNPGEEAEPRASREGREDSDAPRTSRRRTPPEGAEVESPRARRTAVEEGPPIRNRRATGESESPSPPSRGRRGGGDEEPPPRGRPGSPPPRGGAGPSRGGSDKPPKQPSKLSVFINENPHSKKIMLACVMVALVVAVVGANSIWGLVTGEGSELDIAIEAEQNDKPGFLSGLFVKEEEVVSEVLEDPNQIDNSGFQTVDGTAAFVYNEAERKMMQDAGLTDDIITVYEMQAMDAMQAIDAFKAEQTDPALEKFPELKEEAMKAGSPEYKKLLSKTQLGLTPFDLKIAEPENMGYVTSKAVETVPYEKLGARGHQLFLKLTSYVYGDLITPINPRDYGLIRDTGSVVITYTVENDDKGHVLIYDIQLDIRDSVPKGE